MFHFHSDHSANGKKGGIFWGAGQGFVSTIKTRGYVHLMWEEEKRKVRGIRHTGA